jgi:hypothetical protein
MSLLSSLAKVLTRDLTGRTWQKESTHAYFQNLIYFGSRNQGESYWEAELSLFDGEDGRIGITMTGTPEGPTKDEERFCREVVGNPNALFERCRAAFDAEFLKWTKQPIPANWRDAFRLDGFQVPVSGDPSENWQVCYFVVPAGHYFTAVFASGKVSNVVVDG